MPKLNQIVAIAEGEKTRQHEALSKINNKVQKPAMFDGLVRTYRPTFENEPELPREEKRLQERWNACMSDAVHGWSKLFDIVATLDRSNCDACADIVVDADVLVANVPITSLLFLKRQFENVRKFVSNLPELDGAESWRFDASRNCHVTESQKKIRTRKVPRVLVKYEVSEFHPAQTERFDEDFPVGEWNTVLMSGKITTEDKKAMLERIDTLAAAIKSASVHANSVDATKFEVAKKLFGYVLG